MKPIILWIFLWFNLGFSFLFPSWLIDVRTKEEYERDHIDKAIQIHFLSIRDKIQEVTKDKSDTIEVYCQSGARSAVAKRMLESIGYTNVINLGGIEDARKIKDEEESEDP